jgi:hypothetical protein
MRDADRSVVIGAQDQTGTVTANCSTASTTSAHVTHETGGRRGLTARSSIAATSADTSTGGAARAGPTRARRVTAYAASRHARQAGHPARCCSTSARPTPGATL